MSTSTTSVVSHFPKPQNGFTTTTSGSVASGATTVGLNSVAGYTNGEIAVFVIDPTDSTKKQTFTGTIDTAGVQVTSVVWTAGTNQTHALGATIVDYATATHIAMMSKGILVEHSQDGTHKAALITSRTEDTSPDPDADFLLSYDTSATALKKVKISNLAGSGTGWVPNVLPAPDTITANGNRSYDMVFNSTDLTGTISNGMRLKLTRTVTAPTQCTSLNGTTQYYSKTSPAGMTFTDDFVVSAWVKLSSYNSGSPTIASRFNGTSGWAFDVNASGQLRLTGFNAGASNYSQVISYQSVPLNKWVHVAAQLDMSTFTATTTTSYVMFDGLDVPASVSRSGTNPTALVQAGDINIGASNAAQFFPGKIAQVAIFNAKVTQATMRGYISQGFSGSETSLISAYSFNNSINDLSANANNLTANGSATATNADSPFGLQADGTTAGTTEYAIVTKTAFSTNTTLTVQVPEGNAIPTSGGVSAVSYSTQKVPYGFPAAKGKWRVKSLHKTNTSQSPATANTWYNIGSVQLSVPIGEWSVKYSASVLVTQSAAAVSGFSTLSTANNTESDTEMTQRIISLSSGTNTLTAGIYRDRDLSLSSSTLYYLNHKSDTGSGTNGFQLSNQGEPTIVEAELAYI